MNSVRFAVIGAGHIGKRHAEMISRNPDAELKGICDPRGALNSGFEGDSPFFEDAEEMIEQLGDEIDVVCICTPNGLHAQHAMLALKHKKHIVVEKPMALTKADGEAIIHKALQVNRNVFCVMQNRYSPPSVWLRGVMDQEALGKIRLVEINCYWNRGDEYYAKSKWKGTADLDGGVLFTQFSHFIDIMYWLFGDITNIESRFGNFAHEHNTDFEDTGFVSFDFLSGGMGMISYSTAVERKNLESSMTIIAEKGTVKIGGQYMNEVLYCDIENYEMPKLPEAGPANDYGTYKGSAANHHFTIDNVVQTINGHSNITTNALEGLKVVEIIERIYSSGKNPWRTGKK